MSTRRIIQEVKCPRDGVRLVRTGEIASMEDEYRILREYRVVQCPKCKTEYCTPYAPKESLERFQRAPPIGPI